MIALVLTACPPGGQDSTTTTEPGSSSSVSGSSTSGGAPTTTGSTDPTSTGSSTTDASATTSVDPGTTQPDTTGNTTGSDTTGGDTTGTTADENTSTGDTGDTQGLPDTTGGQACEGDPEPVDIEWSLEVPPALVGKPLTGDCQESNTEVMGPDTAVSFDCIFENMQHTVVLHYSLAPEHEFKWELVNSVKLTFRGESGPWTNEWLAITGGEINFRGVHADALSPPDISVKDFYGMEISIAAPCDPQPDPCGQRQGLELQFPHVADGNPTYVPGHSGDHLHYGFPVPNSIWLEQATRLLKPIGCDNVAPVWLDLVFFEDFTNF